MYAAVKAMSDGDIEDVFFAQSGPMDSNDVDSLRASTLKLIRQLAAGKSKPARLLGQVKRPGRPNKNMKYYPAVLTFWEARHKARRGDKDPAAIKAVRARHPEVKLSDASLKDTCMTLGRRYGWSRPSSEATPDDFEDHTKKSKRNSR
jgi:hypothetical protein